MKRLLILAENFSTNKKALAVYMGDYLKGQSEVLLARFSELTFEIEQGKVTAQIGGQKLSSFDLVIFRGVPFEFLPVAQTLALALKSAKIEFFDSAYGEIGLVRSKLVAQARLALSGLPIISSFFCWRTKIDDNIDLIEKKFGFPLVAKEIFQQRGRGVFLIKDKKDFEIIKKTPIDWQFFFQPFLVNDKEYRVGVFGYQPAIFYQKMATNKEEFRRNTALGAKEVYFDVSRVPREMKSAAVLIARILMLEITGIDFLIDGKGKMWILEANREPGFSEPAISPELPTLASFVAKQLGIKK